MEYYHWQTGEIVDESEVPQIYRDHGLYLPLSGGGIRCCERCVHNMFNGSVCDAIYAEHKMRPLTPFMRSRAPEWESKHPHLVGKLCYNGNLWEEDDDLEEDE